MEQGYFQKRRRTENAGLGGAGEWRGHQLNWFVKVKIRPIEVPQLLPFKINYFFSEREHLFFFFFCRAGWNASGDIPSVFIYYRGSVVIPIELIVGIHFAKRPLSLTLSLSRHGSTTAPSPPRRRSDSNGGGGFLSEASELLKSDLCRFAIEENPLNPDGKSNPIFVIDNAFSAFQLLFYNALFKTGFHLKICGVTCKGPHVKEHPINTEK